MRWPRSLRGRLVLAHAILAAVTVLGAATGMLILVERVVWAPIDAAIEEEAETLAVLVDMENPGDLVTAVARIGREQDLGTDKFVRVVDGNGRVLATAGAAAVTASRSPESSVGRFATVERGGRYYRVVRYPTDRGGATEIGVRAERPLRVLRRARWTVSGIAACLLCILLVLALVITGRATGELDRLASELETIEEGSLHHRLQGRDSREVDRLAAVLNRLLARLERAMEQMRRFTADAAHELRTPLAALRARLEIAVRQQRSPEQLRDAILDALEQTERLARLAEDLLMLSMIEARAAEGALQPIALDDVVREAAEFFRPLADEERRTFACTVERTPQVQGSATLLKRLLLNLVGNAFRHTPAGSAVRITLRREDPGVTLEVQDEGPGIPEPEVGGMFERFRRGPDVTGGTGLGLAICREIVSMHHGHMRLASVPGAGTTVRVTLPASGS